MKYLKMLRIHTAKTSEEISYEQILDYSHFLYNHKSSFKDFYVLYERDDLLIYFSKNILFNFIPFSPSKNLINIRRIDKNNKIYKQTYVDLKNKQISYMKVTQKREGDFINVVHEFAFPISNYLYPFKSIIFFLANLHMRKMWKEDKAVIEQKYIDKFVANNEKIISETIAFEKNFDKYINEKFTPDYSVKE